MAANEQQAQLQLQLDLDELKHLQSIAKRPRVISLLSSEIHNVDSKLSKLAVQVQPSTPVVVKAPSAATNAFKYNSLGSFSWDQDTEKIRIYLFLEGVDPEKMDSVIKPSSVDIKMHDVQGKNYRYAIPKLNKEIVPEKSKVVVKPTRVVLTLFKSSKGNWLDLQFKEDELKPNLDKEKDPMAGIMDLMKNMYEEGDDDMKRTIAKAWTDARAGKTTDSLKDFP
ncbi:hypothetical protein LUZ63_019773 [Rhynchospora breviuscula]|uniref:Calcyclin-binding protein n=1 Tax=Rhynchospora breviuscula TaxID=2022672 RepID=A0A9Q0C6W6_9POAL|nr:hypothetical protein LUZ63_019773 [Rhynchospora breviuscula]